LPIRYRLLEVEAGKKPSTPYNITLYSIHSHCQRSNLDFNTIFHIIVWLLVLVFITATTYYHLPFRIGGSFNGRTVDSGSTNRGSTPCPPVSLWSGAKKKIGCQFRFTFLPGSYLLVLGSFTESGRGVQRHPKKFRCLCKSFLDKRGENPPFGEVAEWSKAPAC
jgi:hypothetical protein